jgi:hypothetical protein
MNSALLFTLHRDVIGGGLYIQILSPLEQELFTEASFSIGQTTSIRVVHTVLLQIYEAHFIHFSPLTISGAS